jgi:predicted PurR-regulated permease PerM
MNAEKRFSFFYSQIVEGENDMIGHITYSLYKTSKIKFIEKFKEGNEGRIPTEKELETFYISAENHISSYRIQAEQLLSDFISRTVDASLEDMEKQMLINQQDTLREIINPLIPPPPKGPWAGFGMAVIVKGTQTVVVAIIIFFILFFASVQENGFWPAVKKLFPEHEKNHTIPTNSLAK